MIAGPAVRRVAGVVVPAGVAVAGWAAGRRSVRGELAAVRQSALVDPLTRVANRAGLAAAAAAVPGPPAWLGVVLVDLDEFKPVNDTHGHAAGDLVLAAVASRLAGVGVAGRLGGDEFAVLIGGLPADGSVAARRVLAAAERVFGVLSAPYVLPGAGPVRIGASVGAAAVPAGSPAGLTLPGALAAADLAMYGAKEAGGGVRLAPILGRPATRACDVVPVQHRPAGRLRDASRAQTGAAFSGWAL